MKLRVAVMTMRGRCFGGVVVAAHKINRAFVFLYKFQERFDPFLVCAAADSRAADLKARVNFLYGA